MEVWNFCKGETEGRETQGLFLKLNERPPHFTRIVCLVREGADGTDGGFSASSHHIS